VKEDFLAAVVVVGAGPGLGTAIARRFGVEGMAVGLVSRSADSVNAARTELARSGVRAVGVTADAAQERQLTGALDALAEQLGPPGTVVYNAGLIQHDRPGDLTPEQHQAAYAVNVLGALTAAVHVAPGMTAAGGGAILITGGMPEPDPEVTSLSLGKAGVRALTALLARQYGPAGIHVATVTVADAVQPGGRFDPHRIADQYWRLYDQPPGAWQHEVLYSGEPQAAAPVPGE
jgi:NAD(P)-dependent dehydrogenase (short-subunit alcohol dehydrogenase family)